MPKKIGSTFTPKPRERKYDFGRMGIEPTGEVFLLEKGTDYQCSESSLRGHIREYAKAANLQYASQIRREGKRLLGVEVAFTAGGAALPGMTAGASDAGSMATTSGPPDPAGEDREPRDCPPGPPTVPRGPRRDLT